MSDRLRCRYTGRVVQGPFVLADDADLNWEHNACPECGAEGYDECTLPEGDSLSPYVHSAREGGDDAG